jgi:hypothetical protein
VASSWQGEETVQEAVPATAAAAPERTTGSILARMLTHPLLLLVVGGLISGLAADLVAQRWQDHQRALDSRRTFVTEMTQSAMRDVVALDRFAGVLAGYPKYGAAGVQRQWSGADSADKRWVIGYFTIAARLRAYYARSPVNAAWTAVAERMSSLWADEQGIYQDFAKTRTFITSQRWLELKKQQGLDRRRDTARRAARPSSVAEKQRAAQRSATRLHP